MHGDTRTLGASASAVAATEPTGSDAAGARRAGRPARVPTDESAFSSPYVDAWQRVAWLLSVSRLHRANGAYAGRADFVEAMRAHQVSADLTRVSRWESGQTPSARVLGGYEAVLGLTPGSLVSLTAVLTRGPANTASTWRPNDDVAISVETTEELLDRAIAPTPPRGGRLSGQDWMALVGELTRFDAVLLTRSTWSALLERLLTELTRCAPVDGINRYEACAQLLAQPAGRRHLIRVIGRWLSDPDVQSVEHSVSMLIRDSSGAGNELVQHLVESSVPRVREVATYALATKLSRGHYRGAALTRIEKFLSARLRDARPSPAVQAAVAQLSPRSRRRVLEKAGSPQLRVRTEALARTATSISPEAASRVARAAAAAAKERLGESPAAGGDPMLERLVQESLFHALVHRRWLASLVLAHSPYADVLSELAVELAQHPDAAIAAGAWEMLRWTGHSGSAQIGAAALAEQRQGLRPAAILSLRASPLPLTPTEARQLREIAATDDEVLATAAVAVLGLRAPEALVGLDGSGAALSAAGWWLRTAPLADEPPIHP